MKRAPARTKAAPSPGKGVGRRVRYSVAMSLDGYIAGPSGEYDWIVMDPEIDFGALMGSFDAMLMGRKTYEAAQKMGGGPASRSMQVHVLSRTLRQSDCKGVTVSDDAKASVTQLKAAPGKDIWLFGGGSLFRSLLELRLVDSVEVAIIPVLLGGGVPLLPDPAARAKLKLANHKVYSKTGTVALEYTVAR